ncbi:unnamed protein product, partial [Amoebophrya sp. A25]
QSRTPAAYGSASLGEQSALRQASEWCRKLTTTLIGQKEGGLCRSRDVRRDGSRYSERVAKFSDACAFA